jgi:hypothetical protein
VSRAVGTAIRYLLDLFGYYHDDVLLNPMESGKNSRPWLAWLGIVDAHKIKRCVVFLHALLLFSRAYLVGRACNRDYLLAAAAACRLRACASPTRT